MKKAPISVIILTYNEEKNIKQALDNVVSWADQVIVVDSFSDDETLDILDEYDVDVYEHEFKDYAAQFNWALDNTEIDNDWVMKLDADEWLTKDLKEEIRKELKNVSDDVSGYMMKRRVYFMGKWMRHGGYYPTWILRLWRKDKGRLESRKMDEHTKISDGKVEELENDFVDQNHKSLSWWIEKHNGYATREMKSYFEDKEAEKANLGGGQISSKRWYKNNLYYKMPKFCRAFLYFIYRYIFRLGFLDGIRGLIFHFLQGCWYRFLVDAKIYEQENKNN